jgi:hypothetical protein
VFNSEVKESFRNAWAIYDPDATGFMPILKIKSFLFELHEPLGWNEVYINDNEKQETFINQMNIPTYCRQMGDIYIQFGEVLESLTFFMLITKEVEKAIESSETTRMEKRNTQKERLIKNLNNQLLAVDKKDVLKVKEMQNMKNQQADDNESFI